MQIPDEPLTKVNISNYLGLSNQEYTQRLYNISLTTPSVYTTTKIRVLKALKQEFSKHLYNTFYNLMLYGKDANGTDLITFPSVGLLEPQLPLNEVQSFSLSVVKTFAEIVDEVIEKILPSQFDAIVSRKMGQFGKTENIQN
jgi:hypothetical protein